MAHQNDERVEDEASSTIDSSSPPIHLILTAFGPFGGVMDNPSMALLRELPEFLNEGWKGEVRQRLLHTLVVETSTEGVKEAISEIQEKIEKDGDRVARIVCLHVGVNVFGNGYHIEECAYNDATFRIPDERKYQPTGEKIIGGAPWGKAARSKLKVTDLVRDLETSFPAIESKVSEDPGRFVCNYMYYTSLERLQDKLAEASLFLHIPPFAKIPKEIQLEYLAEVMRILCQVDIR